MISEMKELLNEIESVGTYLYKKCIIMHFNDYRYMYAYVYRYLCYNKVKLARIGIKKINKPSNQKTCESNRYLLTKLNLFR